MERHVYIVNPDLSLNVTNLAAFLRSLPILKGATDRYIGAGDAGTTCTILLACLQGPGESSCARSLVTWWGRVAGGRVRR